MGVACRLSASFRLSRARFAVGSSRSFEQPVGDPQVTDERIRLVEIAAEVGRLVDGLELHVPKAGCFEDLPNPVAICETRKVPVHLAVAPELAADSQRVPDRGHPLVERQVAPDEHGQSAIGYESAAEISERRHGIVEEHRAEGTDHKVDCRPVERVHLRVRSLEPDVRQSLLRCARASDGQHRR